jgi:hypothetical protein
MGYLIEPPVQAQIVTAKVTLRPADLLAPSITDIPEYPATPNYYWQVLSMNGYINNGTTLYVGTSSVHIQASTALASQFRFSGAFMTDNIGTWGFSLMQTALNNPIQFVDNDNLQIHNPSGFTLGDSNLTLYITAILIPS